MDKNLLQDLPSCFDRLGGFLYGLKKLSEIKATKGAAEFLAELDKLLEKHSDSALDIAIGDYNTIVNAIYNAAASGCPSGSTRIRS